MKLLIATAYYDIKAYAPYVKSIVHASAMLTRSGIDFGYYEVCGDSYPDRAKNNIANYFLESDYTDLIIIDSDHSWDLQGFIKLVQSNHEIISGAYTTKNGKKFTGEIVVDEKSHPIVDVSGKLLANWVAGGFIKYKKEVFQKMAVAYPDEWYNDPSADPQRPDRKYFNFFRCELINHVRCGEDVGFCLRWKNLGGKIYVEPNITIGHFWTEGHFGNLYNTIMATVPKSEDVAPKPELAQEDKNIVDQLREEINRITNSSKLVGV